MKTRLPLLVERSIAEAEVARSTLAKNYDIQLRARLTSENVTISCKKGCNHCCRHPVFLTLLEGATLYQALVANGLWTSDLKERLQKTSEQTWGLAPEVWSLSLIPCPLLDPNGLCGAYESRPFVCRVTYSIGEPDNCHPHRLGPGMLPKRELIEMTAAAEAPLLGRHKLAHFRVPLATAILFGQKIVDGELELEDSQKSLGALG